MCKSAQGIVQVWMHMSPWGLCATAALLLPWNYCLCLGGLLRCCCTCSGDVDYRRVGISRQVKFAVVNFHLGNFAEPPGFCVVNFTVVNFADTPRNVEVCRALRAW